MSIIESSLCMSTPALKESFKTTSVHNIGEAQSESYTGSVSEIGTLGQILA